MSRKIYIGEDNLINLKNAMAGKNIGHSTFMQEDKPPYEKDEFTIKIQYPTDNFTGCCIISVNKGSFITYIFGKEIYAHELQHCLRLCGLNKLADNLKIE
jgi:hypothetical protein